MTSFKKIKYYLILTIFVIIILIPLNALADWYDFYFYNPSVYFSNLIKTKNSPAVYYIAKDSPSTYSRYAFPDEKTFFTWFNNFDVINVISDSEMSELKFGGIIMIKPYTKWIKLKSSPNVYFIEKGGISRLIPNEEIAYKLKGPDWKYNIIDIPESLFTNYKMGKSLDINNPFSDIKLDPELTIDQDLRIRYHENNVIRYSLDEYDGIKQYLRGGTNLVLLSKGTIMTNYFSSLTTTGVVTFDISNINWDKLKTLKFYLYQLNEKDSNFSLSAKVWEVNDNDYQSWQDCEITAFGNGNETQITYQKPPNCVLINYNEINVNLNLIKNENNLWWGSNNLRDLMIDKFKNKKHITFAINALSQNTIEFEDGGNHNGSGNLPYLELTY